MKEIDYIQVVERDRGKLIGIVSSYLRLQRADAEDVVQKTLENAWLKHHTCKGELEKWLIACCINHGLKFLRSQGRLQKRMETAEVLKAIKPSMF